MNSTRIIEYTFFFALLGLAGYMVWLITKPFISTLALSAIIVTICYPLYMRIRRYTPKNNKTAAAFVTTLIALLCIVLPVALASSMVVREAVSVYQELTAEDTEFHFEEVVTMVETRVQVFYPEFQIDAKEHIESLGTWLSQYIGVIFAGTVSTIFVFIISMIGSFYFFRDGKELMNFLIKASPLPDHKDEVIFERMAVAVRAVVTGTVFLALLQGLLVTIGFLIFGIDRAILWGSFAAVGALIPGVGTTIVTAPAIIYLFSTGQNVYGVGLLFWAATIVGMIDNILGPYLIGKGSNMHPFIILISVLGGIVVFGPIGFIVGPVIVTLFLVLLEMYSVYIAEGSSFSTTEPLEPSKLYD